MSNKYILPSLPPLPGTKAEYLAQVEAAAIFAAASAAAEVEIARTAEAVAARAAAVRAARAAAKHVYDTTAMFLVWPDGLCAYEVGGKERRTVYAPWHKFLGTRLNEYGYYMDSEPAPEGAAYFTAEQLGFTNAELVAHARDLESLRNAMYWKRFGGPPRALRYRVHRVGNAIAGQIAAWYRRREAVAAWRRSNPAA